MERYAPNAKDLASRDVVSRSMTIEIREGRCVCVCVCVCACVRACVFVHSTQYICAKMFYLIS